MRALLCPSLILGLLWAFRSPSEQRIVSVVIDPATTPITMHWADDSGKALGNIGRLKAIVEAKGRHLRFAMNGGMYMEDLRPLGLYMENGRTVRKLITATKGFGNFYMQPNGVFSAADGMAAIFPTAKAGTLEAKGYATQSGPMLVVDGAINAAFKQGSANVHIRNGVGLLPDGQVLFAISKEPVNFYDFARFFQQAGCGNALFLDGGISRAYMPDQGLVQLDGRLGPLIAVVE
ncbi:MAG: phosphodiester glycosidase family protein [Flavobacteriales bacterium]|nr:phosphodiester glycosidase family protein [Flavobacteriales bacterium]